MKTLLCALVLIVTAQAWAEDGPPKPCREPEARQFDFWIGEWDVTVLDKVVGHNKITRIQDGCTLFEEYNTLPRPYTGKSFNYYDSSDGQWHQDWVDNSGIRLHLKGGFADHQMIMTGDRIARGQELRDRITWTDNQDGTVRQEWDVSSDGGETWRRIFDGLYKPATEAEETVGP